jgi:hypothetical protein
VGISGGNHLKCGLKYSLKYSLKYGLNDGAVKKAAAVEGRRLS